MEQFDLSIQKSYAYDAKEFAENTSRWDILRELYQRNFDESNHIVPKIPKIIHQIWLGSKLPDKYCIWAETWKDAHPDWEYRLWTDADTDKVEMTNRQRYYTLSNYGAKSDYLRYHILNQFGGLYIDTDFECIKPFDALLGYDFVTGIGYPIKPELYVGLIACVAHHPIMQRIVKDASSVDTDIPEAQVLNMISSYFFTRNFFGAVGKYMPGVVALPPDYFYPFPNSKGHERQDGRKFVKPCSYALHHWEVSWSARSGRIDWIQGDKFTGIGDSEYSPKAKRGDDYDKLPNTFDPGNLKDLNYVYTHTFYVKQLFNIIQHLGRKFIIITHNSDENVDQSYVIPDNVVMWYSQNVNMEHPKLQGIPIGLMNDRWDRGNNRKVIMIERLKKVREYRNLAYMNHEAKTNLAKRRDLVSIFANAVWVTKDNRVPFESYIKNIYNHKFVICPEGNGLDTHRIWEALYMRTIPIVIRSTYNSFFSDLPICFVNSWDEVTESFLNREYDRISKAEWDLSKLNFEYWKRKILGRWN
jgi:hypothetical protein